MLYSSITCHLPLLLILFFFFISATSLSFFFFFFNDTAPPEIYPLPLPDALPISPGVLPRVSPRSASGGSAARSGPAAAATRESARRAADALRLGQGGGGRSGERRPVRSEEHTSELQSRLHLVCRLLLEKKKKNTD